MVRQKIKQVRQDRGKGLLINLRFVHATIIIASALEASQNCCIYDWHLKLLAFVHQVFHHQFDPGFDHVLVRNQGNNSSEKDDYF